MRPKYRPRKSIAVALHHKAVRLWPFGRMAEWGLGSWIVRASLAAPCVAEQAGWLDRAALGAGWLSTCGVASKKAVNQWCNYVVERMERRARMAAVLAGFQGGLRKALNGWLSFVEGRRMMTQSMERLVRGNEARARSSWPALP